MINMLCQCLRHCHGLANHRRDDVRKAYAVANPAIFKKFGAKFVVRSGKYECLEGNSRSRNVVIEFPDYATAVACYKSPEYQSNMKIRQANAITDLIIVEGYDGP